MYRYSKPPPVPHCESYPQVVHVCLKFKKVLINKVYSSHQHIIRNQIQETHFKSLTKVVWNWG
jgi:hypothetical protein